jgi:hypothetical protein
MDDTEKAADAQVIEIITTVIHALERALGTRVEGMPVPRDHLAQIVGWPVRHFAPPVAENLIPLQRLYQDPRYRSLIDGYIRHALAPVAMRRRLGLSVPTHTQTQNN